jgi:hypothetical protein
MVVVVVVVKVNIVIMFTKIIITIRNKTVFMDIMSTMVLGCSYCHGYHGSLVFMALAI